MKNLTNEMLQKAGECKTVEELLNLAKENDYPLTEKQATAKFNQLNKIGELADEELENVAGGACLELEDLYNGQNVRLWSAVTQRCDTCSSDRYIITAIVDRYIELVCVNQCSNMYKNSDTRAIDTAFGSVLITS